MRGPPRWLVELPDEQLFQRFVTACSTLAVDENGIHCLATEAEALHRMARQITERAALGSPQEKLAATVRLLLGYAPLDKLKPPIHLVNAFYRERAELADLLPATPVTVPDTVPDFTAAELVGINRPAPRFTESHDADAIAANEAMIEQARREELGYGR